MNHYTTPEQTAKLIELGFEKPKSIGGYEPTFHVNYEGIEVSEVIIGADKNAPIYAYSIGELIEMLPKTIEVDIWWGREKGKAGTWGLRIDTNGVDYMWTITYERDHSANLGVVGASEELIDALYDMVVKLKEEGVI